LAIVAAFILFIRLIDIQVVQAGTYRARALRELSVASTILAPRGTITDINGVDLARSVAAETIVVDQTQITNPSQAASIAAPILNLDPTVLAGELTGKLRYRIIAKDVSPQAWNDLQAAINKYNSSLGNGVNSLKNQINGFYNERSYIREYPNGSLGSSLIGFVNDQGVGAAGIENSLDSTLSGTNGQYLFQDGAGTIIPGSQQIINEPKAGTSVRLTINRDIEWVAQDAITQAVKSAKALDGTVIVMDPRTGAILAEASAPNYDPNNPKTRTANAIRNPAVQDVYAPGSTGKVITVSAALENGTTSPTTVYDIPPTYKLDGNLYHDAEKHGDEKLTTTGILAASSNIGAIKIGAQMSNATLYSYLTKFGIGQSTNSGLQGEQYGILRPVNTWAKSDGHGAAFGQSYSVTAMQVTQIFNTIANDGIKMQPHVIAGSYNSDGTYIPNVEPAGVRVVSAKTAQTVRNMLESVVSADGTAPEAAIPGYRVAGKTGTATRYNDSCHCYKGYTASFVGMAPADHPQYVVSVVIQDPKGAYYGGVVSAPVFKTVMSFVLQTEHVAPTSGKPTSYPLNAAELANYHPGGGK
jgi:cell division protein FtsI (penicillin-binding protein 3)